MSLLPCGFANRSSWAGCRSDLYLFWSQDQTAADLAAGVEHICHTGPLCAARERSPAGAIVDSQAAAALCCPRAADDPVPWCHTFSIIARSLSGLMLHGVTEAGMSPTGGLVTVCQARRRRAQADTAWQGWTVSQGRRLVSAPACFCPASPQVPSCCSSPRAMHHPRRSCTHCPFPFCHLHLQVGVSSGL